MFGRQAFKHGVHGRNFKNCPQLSLGTFRGMGVLYNIQRLDQMAPFDGFTCPPNIKDSRSAKI